MVEKGEYIDFAANIDDSIQISTELEIIRELAIKIKELETRIVELEKTKGV